MFDFLFDFLLDIGNYDQRKVGVDNISGITISTVLTSDEGYETAVIDNNGVHPVQRYDTKENTKKGHKLWCEKAPKLEKITKLGWTGVVDEEEIILERETDGN